MHFTDICAKNIPFLHNYALKVQKNLLILIFFCTFVPKFACRRKQSLINN